MTAALPVTFVLLGDKPRSVLERFEPDRDWREFITGERAWILQTFLRLRDAGLPVALNDELPASGIVVFTAKQRRELRRARARPPSGALLVATRGDVGAALIADFEIVQNRHTADARRRFFVPHWPQPGLVPRDPARGSRIENIAFKGFSGNLHPDFHGAAWLEFLRANHLSWREDAVPHARHATQAHELAWNDFRAIDLVVAVRRPDARLHPRKPATKLINSWHAGVPALLGPEVAYRELRQSPLDYVEVADVREAQATISRLRAEPARYEAMVAHGRQRAQEFSIAAITEQWRRLLFDVLPAHTNDPHVRRWRGRPLALKELVRRLTSRFERRS